LVGAAEPYIFAMNPDDLARLSYLVLLGVAVVGWFIAQNRGGLGKAAQQAMVWGLIFIGVIAGFGLWNDIQRDLAPSQALLSDGRIEVPVSRDGHYHLTLGINGTPIDFVIDTGASQIVLTREDAARPTTAPGWARDHAGCRSTGQSPQSRQ